MTLRLLGALRRQNAVVLDSALAVALLGRALYIAEQTAGRLALHALVLSLVFLPLAFRRLAPIPFVLVIGAALLTNISLGFADSFFETFAILLAACTAVADARWVGRSPPPLAPGGSACTWR